MADDMDSKTILKELTAHLRHNENPDFALKICSSRERGRFIVATRDIRSGEIIIVEPVVVSGPIRRVSKPLCLGCYSTINETNQHLCSICGLPLCSKQCETADNHIPECTFLSDSGFKVTPKTLEDMLKIYQFIMPLRCILLSEMDPHTWRQLEHLESHANSRKKTMMYELYGKIVVEPISLLAPDRFDAEQIHKVCGIIDTNAFEGRNENIKCIFPFISMFNHDCSPSAEWKITNKNKAVVKAVRSIEAGEEIMISYTKLFWSTQIRRRHLFLSKVFWCTCSRCAHPTEFGSYLSALSCRKCSGMVLSSDPLGEAVPWKCQDCSHEMSAKQVAFYQQALSGIAKNVDKTKPEVIEEFIENHSRILPPSNHVMVDMKLNLVRLYGNCPGFTWTELTDEQIQRKIGLCRELMDITDKLQKGLSRHRGFFLYWLQGALLQKAKRLSEKREHAMLDDSVRALLEEALASLEEADVILEGDPAAPTDLSDSGESIKRLLQLIMSAKLRQTQRVADTNCNMH